MQLQDYEVKKGIVYRNHYNTAFYSSWSLIFPFYCGKDKGESVRNMEEVHIPVRQEDFMAKSLRIRIAVIIPRNNEILLVKHVKGNREYWLVPGGGLDFGETIEDCARRELKEETNLDIKLIKLLFISESVSREEERHLINLTFLGQVLNSYTDIRVGGDSRVQDAVFVPVEKLRTLEIHPPIAPFILRSFREEFRGNALFLGNLWSYTF